MFADRFADDPVAMRLIARLYTDVGGFFCNTRRGMSGTCDVCTGPANSAVDPALCARAATYLHGPCVSAALTEWHAVTFVQSATRSDHPLALIARRVHGVYPTRAKVGLAIGPGFDAPPARVPRADRFTVPDKYLPFVTGQHVLVVEDTWVSGDKAQSAALALRAAGATSVTILCVTRWLRYDWPDHRQLIETLVEPYNAARCPVTGAFCPSG